MVGDSNPLFTRFVFEERHFRKSDAIVKWTAFMPDKVGETSVFRIDDVPEATIWAIGTNDVATSRGKPLLARADVCQNAITTAGLQAEPEQSTHPLHAIIVGWPDDKIQQKEKALQLWQKARSYPVPKGHS
jgi:hypothetical protein